MLSKVVLALNVAGSVAFLEDANPSLMEMGCKKKKTTGPTGNGKQQTEREGGNVKQQTEREGGNEGSDVPGAKSCAETAGALAVGPLADGWCAGIPVGDGDQSFKKGTRKYHNGKTTGHGTLPLTAWTVAQWNKDCCINDGEREPQTCDESRGPLARAGGLPGTGQGWCDGIGARAKGLGQAAPNLSGKYTPDAKTAGTGNAGLDVNAIAEWELDCCNGEQ